jgi:hypothetical protein
MKSFMCAGLIGAVLAIVPQVVSAETSGNGYVDPVDAVSLKKVTAQFHELMRLANLHDVDGIRKLFWTSPSALLVAKSAIPSEGNWAGFWGNDAIQKKLHDIATSGPVVIEPDYTKFKVVGLTSTVAESYVPMNITVSYVGQDGTPQPFLMIINWLKTNDGWKVASEIILPVPPPKKT